MADESRETPFGPLKSDDVTSEEYARAISSLQEFVDMDVTTLHTLEDLSAYASLVGEDIGKIVVAYGQVQETKFDYQHPVTKNTRKAVDRTWVIRKPIGNHTLFTTADNQRAYISAYKIVGKRQLSDYTVSIPVGDIGMKGDSTADMLHISAVDWRSGKAVSYYPANEPNNEGIQQGFARVLQGAVKELLSVTPPPTEIPPAFK